MNLVALPHADPRLLLKARLDTTRIALSSRPPFPPHFVRQAMVPPRSRRRSLKSMEINDMALSVVQWSSGNLAYSIIQIGLSSALFGA